MRVALVVGHDERRQGAYSPALDVHEWEWCGALARQLHTELGLRGVESRVFLREPGGRYSEQMAQLCGKINDWQAGYRGLVVSLHFNSTTEDWAGGCALHWPSSAAGRAAASALSAAAAAAIGNRNRGAIAQDRSWSSGRPPLWILQLTKAPASILEPFFGSNEEDARAGDAAMRSGELAHALADAIARL
jgi:N-acetylmuramoyl-L-alanine amidase